MKNLLQKDFSRKWYIILFIVFCAIRLVLCSNQMVYIVPEAAPIDDMLMFRNAVSITQGNWLGDYNWLTISKQMFFAVWLAFLNICKIPYFIGNHSLYILAAIMLTMAFNPVIKKYWMRLVLALALLFNPTSWADFNSRIYRDNIYPALCMLCFAGIIGLCLRYTSSPKKTIGFAILAGIGLATSWLTREDGIWVLPFVVCALLCYLFCVFMQKQNIKQKLAKMALCLIPFAILFAGITIFSTINYIYYGRYVVSDFTSNDFEAAIGAMSRCDTTGAHPKVFVPYSVRQEIYKKVPLAGEFGEKLDGGKYYQGYGYADKKEFSSGGFYWAVRKAAYEEGFAKDAVSAKKFYTQLAKDINDACDIGLIQTDNKKQTSTMMRFEPEYIPLTLTEMLNSFKVLYTFDQTGPFEEERSFANGMAESLEEIESFLRAKTNWAAQENSTLPYLTPLQNIFSKSLNLITNILKVVIVPSTICAVIWLLMQIWVFFKSIKQKTFGIRFINAVLYIGIALSFVLRIAMISYVEATNFLIGTYLMYLSSAAPLMMLLSAVGTISLLNKIIRRYKSEK